LVSGVGAGMRVTVGLPGKYAVLLYADKNWQLDLTASEASRKRPPSAADTHEESVMKNAINHFEIPVIDMERALGCYETLLGEKLRREIFGGLPYALFPHDEPGVSGALVCDPKRAVGAGTLVYLNADGRLDAILARAERAGASVVLPKTAIGPEGFIALLRDTEGNQVGFNEQGT
jgi:predicted enzyme related to lactoylglutathione lyase